LAPIRLTAYTPALSRREVLYSLLPQLLFTDLLLEYDFKVLAMSWFKRQLLKSSRFAKSAQPTSPSSSHSRQYTMTSHDADILRDCDVQQFYKYTSGRWLWNEKYQLARRYVEFDLPGLLQVSAQAIGARSCVKVEKLPEGNFSKVFLIAMDDGRELIAKIPNPNAGRPHFTTASEAATMDYVRAPRLITSGDC
jgi:hypothetical protein